MPDSYEQTTYLVEHYRPGLGAAELGHCMAGIREAVATPGHLGSAPHFLCSVVVPADEAFLVVVQAETEQQVREAYLRAGVGLDRISLAVLHRAPAWGRTPPTHRNPA